MRTLDPAIVEALAAGVLVRRNLLWVTARDRSTGEPHSRGFWNEDETVDLPVIDGETRQTVTRSFVASGGLIRVGPIANTSDLSTRTVEVTLSPLSAPAEEYLRAYDLRLAPAQLYRAIFDPATWALVADADPRFVGKVEKAPIVTPAIGGEAHADLKLVSRTSELSRANPDVRSDESQKRRSGDRIFRYVGVMGSRTIYWGSNPG